jgi:hypothetical protein
MSKTASLFSTTTLEVPDRETRALRGLFRGPGRMFLQNLGYGFPRRLTFSKLFGKALKGYLSGSIQERERQKGGSLGPFS